jgi:hypothetical protein
MDSIQTTALTVDEFLSGNSTYTAYNEQWKYLFESYTGGEEYRNAQNLIKYTLETPLEYASRLRSAALINHCSSVISVYTSYLFKTSPHREWGNIKDTPELQAFLKDADKDGRSLNAFMKDVATFSSVFGHTWVIVSKPQSNATTRGDEIAMGIRPYVSLITPLSALDWNWTTSGNGGYVLDYFKYVEDINGDTTVVKEWTPEVIVTTILKGDSVYERYEEPNGLGHLPIVPVYSRRSLQRGIGISDIADIADAQSMIYNLLNEIDQSIRIDSHPSLAKTADTIASAGAGSIVQMPDDLDPGLRPYILQSSGANVSSVLATIEALVEGIDKMANVGAVRSTQSRQLSGVAMATEFTLLNSRLAEKGSELELAEEHIIKHFAHYLGREWDGAIYYPDNFNIRDESAELDKLLKAATAPVNSEEFKREVSRQIASIIIDKDDPEIYEAVMNQIKNASSRSFDANLGG